MELFGFPVQKPNSLTALLRLDLDTCGLGGVRVGNQDINAARIAKGEGSQEATARKFGRRRVLA